MWFENKIKTKKTPAASVVVAPAYSPSIWEARAEGTPCLKQTIPCNLKAKRSWEGHCLHPSCTVKPRVWSASAVQSASLHSTALALASLDSMCEEGLRLDYKSFTSSFFSVDEGHANRFILIFISVTGWVFYPISLFQHTLYSESQGSDYY